MSNSSISGSSSTPFFKVDSLEEGKSRLKHASEKQTTILQVAAAAIHDTSLGLGDLKKIQDRFNRRFEKCFLGRLRNSIHKVWNRNLIEQLKGKVDRLEKILQSWNKEVIVGDILNYLPEFNTLSEREKKNLAVYVAHRFNISEINTFITKGFRGNNFAPFIDAIWKSRQFLQASTKLIADSTLPLGFTDEQEGQLRKVQAHLKNNDVNKAQEYLKTLTGGSARFLDLLTAEVQFAQHSITKQKLSDLLKNRLGLKDSPCEFDTYSVVKELRPEFQGVPFFVLEGPSGQRIVLAADQGKGNGKGNSEAVLCRYTIDKQNKLVPVSPLPTDPSLADLPLADLPAKFLLIKRLLSLNDVAPLQTLFPFEGTKALMERRAEIIPHLQEILDMSCTEPGQQAVQNRALAILRAWGEGINIAPKSVATSSFQLTPQERILLNLEVGKPEPKSERVPASKQVVSHARSDLLPTSVPASEVLKDTSDATAPKERKPQVTAELKKIVDSCDRAAREEKEPRTIKAPFDSIFTAYKKSLADAKSKADAVHTQCENNFEDAKARLYGNLGKKWKGAPPPLESLYYAYALGDPHLTHTAELQEVLNAEQELQKANRVLKYVTDLNKKEVKTQDELEIKLAEGRSYDEKLYPHYQVFEILLDIFMRPAQTAHIQTLLQDKSIALQLLMGGGKTAVLLPLIGLLKADGDTLSTILLPENILSSEGEKLKGKLAGFFDRFVYEFPDLKDGVSAASLEEIYNNLEVVQKSGGCLFTTPQRRHAFFNHFTLALESYHKSNQDSQLTLDKLKAIEWGAKILKLLKDKESVICDELDDVLKTKLQFIISLGEAKPLAAEESRLITELMLKLRDFGLEKGCKFDFLHTTSSSASPTEEGYDKTVLPFLINSSIALLGNPEVTVGRAEYWKKLIQENTANIEIYLKTRYRENNRDEIDRAEAWVKSLEPMYRGQLVNLRQTLLKSIPAVLDSRYNSGYILKEDENTHLKMAVPAAGPGIPSETQFSSPLELAIRTMAAHIKVNTPALADLREKLLPQLKYTPESINSTSQKLALSSHCFSGFTGTFWNISTMPKFAEECPDTITEGKTFNRLFEKERDGEIAVCTVTDTSDVLLLEQIKSSNAEVLIDTGGWLRNTTEEKFADQILTECKERFDSVVFHYQGKKVVRIKGNETKDNKTIPFDESTMPPGKRFTIYGKSFTVGTDIKQSEKALGLLTMDKEMILRDEMQGKFRLRQLLDSQKLTILVDPETLGVMKRRITLPNNEPLTLKQLIPFLVENQVEQILIDNYQSATQRADCYIELALRQQIIDDICTNKDSTAAISKYQANRGYFVTAKAKDAWDEFGAIPQRKDRKSKLEEDKTRYREIAEKLGLQEQLSAILACLADPQLFNETLDSKPSVIPGEQQVVQATVTLAMHEVPREEEVAELEGDLVEPILQPEPATEELGLALLVISAEQQLEEQQVVQTTVTLAIHEVPREEEILLNEPVVAKAAEEVAELEGDLVEPILQPEPATEELGLAPLVISAEQQLEEQLQIDQQVVEVNVVGKEDVVDEEEPPVEQIQLESATEAIAVEVIQVEEVKLQQQLQAQLQDRVHKQLDDLEQVTQQQHLLASFQNRPEILSLRTRLAQLSTLPEGEQSMSVLTEMALQLEALQAQAEVMEEFAADLAFEKVVIQEVMLDHFEQEVAALQNEQQLLVGLQNELQKQLTIAPALQEFDQYFQNIHSLKQQVIDSQKRCKILREEQVSLREVDTLLNILEHQIGQMKKSPGYKRIAQRCTDLVNRLANRVDQCKTVDEAEKLQKDLEQLRDEQIAAVELLQRVEQLDRVVNSIHLADFYSAEQAVLQQSIDKALAFSKKTKEELEGGVEQHNVDQSIGQQIGQLQQEVTTALQAAVQVTEQKKKLLATLDELKLPAQPSETGEIGLQLEAERKKLRTLIQSSPKIKHTEVKKFSTRLSQIHTSLSHIETAKQEIEKLRHVHTAVEQPAVKKFIYQGVEELQQELEQKMYHSHSQSIDMWSVDKKFAEKIAKKAAQLELQATTFSQQLKTVVERREAIQEKLNLAKLTEVEQISLQFEVQQIDALLLQIEQQNCQKMINALEAKARARESSIKSLQQLQVDQHEMQQELRALEAKYQQKMGHPMTSTSASHLLPALHSFDSALVEQALLQSGELDSLLTAVEEQVATQRKQLDLYEKQVLQDLEKIDEIEQQFASMDLPAISNEAQQGFLGEVKKNIALNVAISNESIAALTQLANMITERASLEKLEAVPIIAQQDKYTSLLSDIRLESSIYCGVIEKEIDQIKQGGQQLFDSIQAYGDLKKFKNGQLLQEYLQLTKAKEELQQLCDQNVNDSDLQQHKAACTALYNTLNLRTDAIHQYVAKLQKSVKAVDRLSGLLSRAKATNYKGFVARVNNLIASQSTMSAEEITTQAELLDQQFAAALQRRAEIAHRIQEYSGYFNKLAGVLPQHKQLIRDAQKQLDASIDATRITDLESIYGKELDKFLDQCTYKELLILHHDSAMGLKEKTIALLPNKKIMAIDACQQALTKQYASRQESGFAVVFGRLQEAIMQNNLDAVEKMAGEFAKIDGNYKKLESLDRSIAQVLSTVTPQIAQHLYEQQQICQQACDRAEEVTFEGVLHELNEAKNIQQQLKEANLVLQVAAQERYPFEAEKRLEPIQFALNKLQDEQEKLKGLLHSSKLPQGIGSYKEELKKSIVVVQGAYKVLNQQQLQVENALKSDFEEVGELFRTLQDTSFAGYAERVDSLVAQCDRQANSLCFTDRESVTTTFEELQALRKQVEEIKQEHSSLQQARAQRSAFVTALSDDLNEIYNVVKDKDLLNKNLLALMESVSAWIATGSIDDSSVIERVSEELAQVIQGLNDRTVLEAFDTSPLSEQRRSLMSLQREYQHALQGLQEGAFAPRLEEPRNKLLKAMQNQNTASNKQVPLKQSLLEQVRLLSAQQAHIETLEKNIVGFINEGAPLQSLASIHQNFVQESQRLLQDTSVSLDAVESFIQQARRQLLEAHATQVKAEREQQERKQAREQERTIKSANLVADLKRISSSGVDMGASVQQIQEWVASEVDSSEYPSFEQAAVAAISKESSLEKLQQAATEVYKISAIAEAIKNRIEILIQQRQEAQLTQAAKTALHLAIISCTEWLQALPPSFSLLLQNERQELEQLVNKSNQQDPIEVVERQTTALLQLQEKFNQKLIALNRQHAKVKEGIDQLNDKSFVSVKKELEKRSSRYTNEQELTALQNKVSEFLQAQVRLSKARSGLKGIGLSKEGVKRLDEKLVASALALQEFSVDKLLATVLENEPRSTFVDLSTDKLAQFKQSTAVVASKRAVFERDAQLQKSIQQLEETDFGTVRAALLKRSTAQFHNEGELVTLEQEVERYLRSQQELQTARKTVGAIQLSQTVRANVDLRACSLAVACQPINIDAILAENLQNESLVKLKQLTIDQSLTTACQTLQHYQGIMSEIEGQQLLLEQASVLGVNIQLYRQRINTAIENKQVDAALIEQIKAEVITLLKSSSLNQLESLHNQDEALNALGVQAVYQNQLQELQQANSKLTAAENEVRASLQGVDEALTLLLKTQMDALQSALQQSHSSTSAGLNQQTTALLQLKSEFDQKLDALNTEHAKVKEGINQLHDKSFASVKEELENRSSSYTNEQDLIALQNSVSEWLQAQAQLSVERDLQLKRAKTALHSTVTSCTDWLKSLPSSFSLLLQNERQELEQLISTSNQQDSIEAVEQQNAALIEAKTRYEKGLQGLVKRQTQIKASIQQLQETDFGAARDELSKRSVAQFDNEQGLVTLERDVERYLRSQQELQTARMSEIEEQQLLLKQAGVLGVDIQPYQQQINTAIENKQVDAALIEQIKAEVITLLKSSSLNQLESLHNQDEALNALGVQAVYQNQLQQLQQANSELTAAENEVRASLQGVDEALTLLLKTQMDALQSALKQSHSSTSADLKQQTTALLQLKSEFDQKVISLNTQHAKVKEGISQLHDESFASVKEELENRSSSYTNEQDLIALQNSVSEWLQAQAQLSVERDLQLKGAKTVLHSTVTSCTDWLKSLPSSFSLLLQNERQELEQLISTSNQQDSIEVVEQQNAALIAAKMRYEEGLQGLVKRQTQIKASIQQLEETDFGTVRAALLKRSTAQFHNEQELVTLERDVERYLHSQQELQTARKTVGAIQLSQEVRANVDLKACSLAVACQPIDIDAILAENLKNETLVQLKQLTIDQSLTTACHTLQHYQEIMSEIEGQQLLLKQASVLGVDIQPYQQRINTAIENKQVDGNLVQEIKTAVTTFLNSASLHQLEPLESKSDALDALGVQAVYQNQLQQLQQANSELTAAEDEVRASLKGVDGALTLLLKTQMDALQSALQQSHSSTSAGLNQQTTALLQLKSEFDKKLIYLNTEHAKVKEGISQLHDKSFAFVKEELEKRSSSYKNEQDLIALQGKVSEYLVAQEGLSKARNELKGIGLSQEGAKRLDEKLVTSALGLQKFSADELLATTLQNEPLDILAALQQDGLVKLPHSRQCIQGLTAQLAVYLQASQAIEQLQQIATFESLYQNYSAQLEQVRTRVSSGEQLLAALQGQVRNTVLALSEAQLYMLQDSMPQNDPLNIKPIIAQRMGVEATSRGVVLQKQMESAGAELASFATLKLDAPSSWRYGRENNFMEFQQWQTSYTQAAQLQKDAAQLIKSASATSESLEALIKQKNSILTTAELTRQAALLKYLEINKHEFQKPFKAGFQVEFTFPHEVERRSTEEFFQAVETAEAVALAAITDATQVKQLADNLTDKNLFAKQLAREISNVHEVLNALITPSDGELYGRLQPKKELLLEALKTPCATRMESFKKELEAFNHEVTQVKEFRRTCWSYDPIRYTSEQTAYSGEKLQVLDTLAVDALAVLKKVGNPQISLEELKQELAQIEAKNPEGQAVREEILLKGLKYSISDWTKEQSYADSTQDFVRGYANASQIIEKKVAYVINPRDFILHWHTLSAEKNRQTLLSDLINTYKERYPICRELQGFDEAVTGVMNQYGQGEISAEACFLQLRSLRDTVCALEKKRAQAVEAYTKTKMVLDSLKELMPAEDQTLFAQFKTPDFGLQLEKDLSRGYFDICSPLESKLEAVALAQKNQSKMLLQRAVKQVSDTLQKEQELSKNYLGASKLLSGADELLKEQKYQAMEALIQQSQRLRAEYAQVEEIVKTGYVSLSDVPQKMIDVAVRSLHSEVQKIRAQLDDTHSMEQGIKGLKAAVAQQNIAFLSMNEIYKKNMAKAANKGGDPAQKPAVSKVVYSVQQEEGMLQVFQEKIAQWSPEMNSWEEYKPSGKASFFGQELQQDRSDFVWQSRKAQQNFIQDLIELKKTNKVSEAEALLKAKLLSACSGAQLPYIEALIDKHVKYAFTQYSDTSEASYNLQQLYAALHSVTTAKNQFDRQKQSLLSKISKKMRVLSTQATFQQVSKKQVEQTLQKLKNQIENVTVDMSVVSIGRTGDLKRILQKYQEGETKLRSIETGNKTTLYS